MQLAIVDLCTNLGPSDDARLDDHGRFDTKVLGLPEYEVRK